MAAVGGVRPLTADMVFVMLRDTPDVDQPSPGRKQDGPASRKDKEGTHAPTIDPRHQSSPSDLKRQNSGQEAGHQISRPELRDPFADLKTAFEPPKEKLKTFNLKQIVTRNGTVLMNMLERLLETTEIDAHDVETEQTLLEYACQTGNVGLAKLCYRRGANLSARTKKGDTAFNIVTKNQRYDIMEFLHKYGVKINAADKDGRTALHIAAENNDVDGLCRLIER